MDRAHPLSLSTADDMSLDGDTIERQQPLVIVHPATILANIATNPNPNIQRWHTDPMPHPSASSPHRWQPSSLSTIKRSHPWDIENKSILADVSDDDENDQYTLKGGKSLEQILAEAREEELQSLSQTILSQPLPDDELTCLVIERIRATCAAQQNTQGGPHDPIMAPSSPAIVSTTATQAARPYPPVNRVGLVDEHDRPFAEYGHLDRATLAKELDLPAQPSSTASPLSTTKSLVLHSKSFAITAWTDVSKEVVLDYIKKEFGIANLQYICVCEEISDVNHRQHLHIQIILKEKIKRKRPFLDEITGTKCHYQVTTNDLAWNEYIKKEGNYIEFNSFKSTRTRGSKQWSSSSAVAIHSNTSTPRQSLSNVASALALPPVPVTTTTMAIGGRTTRATAAAEERRQYVKRVCMEAIDKAERNVNEAMDHMRQHMPERFVERGTWYLGLFRHLHAEAQKRQQGTMQQREFFWPYSFPNCTPKLYEAVTYWIQNQFPRTSRARCLVLIGPTGTGKTSFATSLPGEANYFQVRFNLDRWNDHARYSIYDDIPWDEFEKRNCPDKISLLTQQSRPIQVTDKYRPTREINVRQPAIVLLNVHNAGSLLEEPITAKQKEEAAYWKKRAFVYIMGPDEYFYQRPKVDQPTTSSDSQRSNLSLLGQDEPRMGEPNEFEAMHRQFQDRQR